MSKRANGEGSVYQQQDGRWIATAYDVNSKRVKFYGRTRTEVLAKRRGAAERLAAGVRPTDAKTHLSAVYERWQTTTLRRSGRALNTQALYRTMLRKHVMPVIGARPIGTIRPTDIEHVLEATSDRLAPSSQRSMYAAMRALFDDAKRDGLIVRNPVAEVRRPSVKPTDAVAMELDELRAFLEAAKGDRLEALWLLYAGTGIRRGEALALRWSDVDGDVVIIRRGLSRVDGVGLVEGDPKSARSRRTIDLSAPLVAALAAHRVRQVTERLEAGAAWTDENRIFTTAVGTALDPRNVNRRMAALVKEAGITATPHTLRHTAATNLLAAGHPVAVVAELLGQSPTILMTTYAHALPTARKAASDSLGDLLG